MILGITTNFQASNSHPYCWLVDIAIHVICMLHSALIASVGVRSEKKWMALKLSVFSYAHVATV
jgi:hypothetical protein